MVGLRFGLVAVAILIAPAFSRPHSIRQIDFGNFTYPWNGGAGPEGLETPWHWMESSHSGTVRLKDGVHRFWDEVGDDVDRERAPGLWLESVTYGDLKGPGEEAAVDLSYSTGGTASWDYLCVYTLDGNRPRLLGWLESGDRADGGLVRVAVQGGQLVLDFADPSRQDGVCCSDGYIRVRYVWNSGHFEETGPRERGDLKAGKPVSSR